MPSRQPLIGVTASELVCAAASTPRGRPAPPAMQLPLAYMHAVEVAGGLPVVISPLERRNVDPLLDRLSGLLVSGGPDLDPSFYGADPHAELGPTDRAVDGFEVALCSQAFRRGIPILGICRGAQVLNVAREGTLNQHVPDLPGGLIDHREDETGEVTTHGVRVAPDSRLAAATGGGPIWVNSWHHQAVDRPGLDLRPVAWSVDSVIEAIEAPGGRFALGVQWHAELLLKQDEHLAIFELLVEAARSFADDPAEDEVEDPSPDAARVLPALPPGEGCDPSAVAPRASASGGSRGGDPASAPAENRSPS